MFADQSFELTVAVSEPLSPADQAELDADSLEKGRVESLFKSAIMVLIQVMSNG